MNILNSILGKIIPSAAAPANANDRPSPLLPESTHSAMSQVDVNDVLNGLAKGRGDGLNWRNSIVDLLKVLDLDSSLTARRELAKELNYTGDPNDSAAMNVWLHKQVMSRLAENGGKIPDELKH